MIEVLNFISVALPGFTGALMFLLTAGQLVARPPGEHRWIAVAIALWLGIFLINLGLGRDLILRYAPFMYALHVPFYFLIGPLLQSYFYGVLGDAADLRFALRFPGYGILLPFVVALMIYIPFWALPADDKLAVLNYTGPNEWLRSYDAALSWVVYLGLLHAALYTAKVFFQLDMRFMVLSNVQIPALWHLRALFLLLTVLFLLAIPVQYFDTVALKRYAVSAVSIAVLWLYLLDFRYPRFFYRVDLEVRSQKKFQKYSKTRLLGIDVARTIAELDRVMGQERLYADEDLSLEKLAAVVGIAPAQLSELLNSVAGVDFRSYINRYRVREARRILAQEPERTILSIAYAVGFNSKTSFNRNFKREVGRTPLEYRLQSREAGSDE